MIVKKLVLEVASITPVERSPRTKRILHVKRATDKFVGATYNEFLQWHLHSETAAFLSA